MSSTQNVQKSADGALAYRSSARLANASHAAHQVEPRDSDLLVTKAGGGKTVAQPRTQQSFLRTAGNALRQNRGKIAAAAVLGSLVVGSFFVPGLPLALALVFTAAFVGLGVWQSARALRRADSAANFVEPETLSAPLYTAPAPPSPSDSPRLPPIPTFSQNYFCYPDPMCFSSAAEYRKAYADNVRRPGTYCGDLELNALGRKQGFKACIWEFGEDGYRSEKLLGHTHDEAAPTVHVLHTPGHWMAFRPGLASTVSPRPGTTVPVSEAEVLLTCTDGNCLFDALAQGLRVIGRPTTLERLRREAAWIIGEEQDPDFSYLADTVFTDAMIAEEELSPTAKATLEQQRAAYLNARHAGP